MLKCFIIIIRTQVREKESKKKKRVRCNVCGMPENLVCLNSEISTYPLMPGLIERVKRIRGHSVICMAGNGIVRQFSLFERLKQASHQSRVFSFIFNNEISRELFNTMIELLGEWNHHDVLYWDECQVCTLYTVQATHHYIFPFDLTLAITLLALYSESMQI